MKIQKGTSNKKATGKSTSRRKNTKEEEEEVISEISVGDSYQATMDEYIKSLNFDRRIPGEIQTPKTTRLPVTEVFFKTAEKEKQLKESPASKHPETKVHGTVSSPGEEKRKLIITSSEKRSREGKLSDGRKWRNTGCTILVKNLNSKKMDKDKLFNLFSIYGLIVRIKPPLGLPDQALVQLRDPVQAERAVHFLKGAKLFGRHLELSIYRHHSMSPTSDTYPYKNSDLNGAMDYSACCSPTKLIRVSKLSPQTTEEDIGSHF